MKVNKYNKGSKGFGIGSEYISRDCSNYTIASNVLRNQIYYHMGRDRPLQSSLNHFFHVPYAKWEGQV